MSDAPASAAEPPRLTVVQFVDADVLDRLGNWLRFVQLGLTDEFVRIVWAAPAGLNIDRWIGGAIALSYNVPHWPSRSRGVARLLDTLRQSLADSDGSIVVHAWSATLGWLAADVADALDAPAIITLSRADEVTPARSLLPRGVGVVATGASLMNNLQGKDTRSGSRLRLVRAAVPPGEFRTRFRGPDDPAVLLCRGPWSNAAVVFPLLSAVAHAVDSGRDLMLFFIEAGPAEPALRDLARRHGLQTRVTFADRVDVVVAMRGADVWCLPEPPLACGTATLEAMAHELVVLAPTGGIEDALIDGETAVIYPPGDLPRLRERLLRIVDRPDEARQLAQAARAHVVQHHSLSKSIAAIVACYREWALARRDIPFRTAPEAS